MTYYEKLKALYAKIDATKIKIKAEGYRRKIEKLKAEQKLKDTYKRFGL